MIATYEDATYDLSQRDDVALVVQMVAGTAHISYNSGNVFYGMEINVADGRILMDNGIDLRLPQQPEVGGQQKEETRSIILDGLVALKDLNLRDELTSIIEGAVPV